MNIKGVQKKLPYWNLLRTNPYDIGVGERIWTTLPYLIFVTNATNIFVYIFFGGVNFYRFNAKNWQFTVYFAVITQKLAIFCVFCRNLRVFSV